MHLPWRMASEKPAEKNVVTMSVNGLTPRDVTRRFYMDEYKQSSAVDWNVHMWTRVSHALDQYTGQEHRHIVQRLAGITLGIAKTIDRAPDIDQIAVDRNRWVYLCRHSQIIKKAASDMQGSLKTFDEGRTLVAFGHDIEQMAQDTGYGPDDSLEKLLARSSQIRNLLGHRP